MRNDKENCNIELRRHDTEECIHSNLNIRLAMHLYNRYHLTKSLNSEKLARIYRTLRWICPSQGSNILSTKSQYKAATL
jgi:hypothetical protein